MPGEGGRGPGAGASGDGSSRGRHFWIVRLVAGDAPARRWEEALAGIAQSVARFEVEPAACAGMRSWRIEAICDRAPVAREIAGLLAEAAGMAVAEIPDIEIETLEDKDWLALNRRQFPPVRAGRFFIHGTHFDGSPPPGAIAIRLDAGPAFGSGTHESTRGALMAIDRCALERSYGRVLDLGCGSGILALALAASTGAAVLASDREDAAVENVRFNAAANGFCTRIEVRLGDGLSAPVRRHAPFDLVAANILAGPLIGMAADLGEVVEPGGILILSGLIAPQEQDVLAAFHAAGFSHRFTIVLGEWSTLAVRRGIRT